MASTEWDESQHQRDDRGRFVASGVIWYVDQQFVAHQRQHASEQRAIEVAASTIATWKADSNEWRATLGDRDRDYAKAGDLTNATSRIELLERANIVRVENERLTLVADAQRREDSERRLSRQQWIIGVGITLLNITVGVLIWFATKH